MARYRRSDGHYADVECAYAEPKRYLVLSSTNKKKATKPLVAEVRRMECTASFAGKARLIIPPQDRNRRVDLRQLKVRIAGWGGWQSRLCWNVFRGFGSRRRDDTNRRTFQPGFYGHTHTGTERRVHVQVTGVSCV